MTTERRSQRRPCLSPSDHGKVTERMSEHYCDRPGTRNPVMAAARAREIRIRAALCAMWPPTS